MSTEQARAGIVSREEIAKTHPGVAEFMARRGTRYIVREIKPGSRVPDGMLYEHADTIAELEWWASEHGIKIIN